eukprot:CAMPEP_0197834668 /NCGR_PEP_ID=MMETSP1437-20131217/23270_1 /TAXON_ID=49252 ORGANISM="Eucampia antarctica, Strain CCMP1452" /NCGR_SAMPLE_ID=MMETSP1437 /ASSEMBLY_ACC=CAM_ASM_001096 /LENGTH=115 /DNA_ID=CAMNT_0043439549 /DNA_START=141 /DNA_END=485 /DNA_ORIENTATION=+
MMLRPALMHGVWRRDEDQGLKGNDEEVEDLDRDVKVRMRRGANFTRNLNGMHELWDELMFGVGSNLSAKYFNNAERGRCKSTFQRRKVIWDKVAEMVRSGWNAIEATNHIYSIYV